MAEGTIAGQRKPEEFSERLYNEDLRPLREDERGWSTYSLFCTWMADVHSIGGYTFAAGLFFVGLTGWQVFLALIAGITAVYFLDHPHGGARDHGLPRGQDRLRAGRAARQTCTEHG